MTVVLPSGLWMIVRVGWISSFRVLVPGRRPSGRAALSKKHPSDRNNPANAHQISLRTIAHCLKALTDS
jgi:hypothetical protein